MGGFDLTKDLGLVLPSALHLSLVQTLHEFISTFSLLCFKVDQVHDLAMSSGHQASLVGGNVLILII